MTDKQAYEDAREYQIALEHKRRVLAMTAELWTFDDDVADAHAGLEHHRWRMQGRFFARWLRR